MVIWKKEEGSINSLNYSKEYPKTDDQILLEIDERNNAFYDKISDIIFNSENSRLCALLDLKKDMMKDYRMKQEKATQ